MKFTKIIFAISLLFPSVSYANENIVTGMAIAISGNTILMDGVTYSLFGVLSPNETSICEDIALGEFDCGAIAREKLDSFLYNNFITCELKKWDNGNKSALCYYEDKIINSLQILSGWGIVKWYDRDEKLKPLPCSVEHCTPIPDYLWNSEINAVANKRGLWNVKSKNLF